MMPKNKRLTIRLDDDLDHTIERACQDKKCDKTSVVISALRKGLGLAEVGQDYQVVKGTIRKESYRIKIDATGPVSKITGLVDEGKEYKFCDRCKKFYRYDENGKPEFWGSQFAG